MALEAKVAVLPAGSKQLDIMTLGLPAPAPEQVTVRLFSSGICHSQLHEIHAPRKQPVLLGHEATGRVLEVGSNVSHVAPGDTVLLTWVPRNADDGSPPPAAASIAIGTDTAVAQSVFTWADHTIADSQYVVRVADDIPRDVSSVIGCAVMTGAGAVINTVDVNPGDSVAVFGAGGVGLCAIAAAQIRGAAPIIAVDLDNEKLDFAMRFGATQVINARHEDPVKAIHALTVREGEFTYRKTPVSGVDYSFDCIGADDTMRQILASCRRARFRSRQGGTAVLVGLPAGKVSLNAMDIVVSEKCFRGSFCGSCIPDVDIPRFIDWHRNGELDLNQLVTRRYPLGAINDAVADLESGSILGRAILDLDPE